MMTIFSIWLAQLGIGIALGAFVVITKTMIEIVKFDKEWKIEHNKFLRS